MALQVQQIPVEQPQRRRFTVDEYYQLAAAGILNPNDRVQLVNGEIIEMPPIGPGHPGRVDLVAIALNGRLVGRAYARVQSPVRLGDYSEPEPDIALIQLPSGGPFPFISRHPTAAEVLLIVEVADSSVAFDLGDKALDYARHGISDLWVLDISRQRLIVHRDPAPDGYASVTEHGRGEAVAPLAFPHAADTGGGDSRLNPV